MLVVCLEAKREESPEVRSVADSCLFVVGTVRPQARGVPVATALCIRTALEWLVTDVCVCVCVCVCMCARVLMCTLVFWIDWDESCEWCGVGCWRNYVLHVMAPAALSYLSVICSGVPRNFFRGGGGFNKFSWGQRELGSGGGSPLVRGSGGSCNLVQEISFHIVKFS